MSLEETVTLFRAGSKDEIAKALAEQMFESGENSLGGKWFAETANDAAKWGELMEGPGNYDILQTQVPKNVADNMLRFDRLDGIGPARYGELSQLNAPGLVLTRVSK